MPQSDERLVAIARGGHDRTFEAIVERCRRRPSRVLVASPRIVGEHRRERATTKEGSTTMRRSQLVFSTAVAGAMLAGTPAAAVADPNTFSSAQKGSLLVSSSALVANRSAEMMGGWVNEKVPCNEDRRLTVRILIDRVRGSHTDRVRRKKTGPVTNCAEGGPNFGFSIRAADVGLACPDGSWKPGRYDFVTNTLHRASGMRAIGTLFFRISDPC